jgi:geranylgeranylglycerol-phosphate geranylgeranyltransferase
MPVRIDSNPDIAAMLAAFLICGFGNIHNDILDIDSDRINHPHRPLSSGTISTTGAWISAGVLLAFAAYDLFLLTIFGRAICIASILLLISYDYGLKQRPFIGNLLVSLLAGMTFILGGVREGIAPALALPGPLIPAVFAFFMHFGREIIKDIQDIAGDNASGSRTVPVHYGLPAALISAYVTYLILIAATLAAYLVGWFSLSFLYINLVCLYLPILLQFVWLGFRPTSAKCRTVSFLLRLEMLPGLAALIIGRQF